MYVVLRRYPLLGVILGLVTAYFIYNLLGSGMHEMRALWRQNAPANVSVHEAVSTSGARWVTLIDGRWYCDDAIIKHTQGAVPRCGATSVPWKFYRR